LLTEHAAGGVKSGAETKEMIFLNNNRPNPSTDTAQSNATAKNPNGFRADFF